MIRDITIGQYYSKDSVIHRLDARTKIFGTFLYIVSMFCFHRYIGFLFCGLFLMLILKLAQIPVKHVGKGLKPIAMILIFTLFINILFSTGTPLFHWGLINITIEGIMKALFMGIRLCFLVFGASILTFTTTPNQLTDGIEKMFGGLNRIHVPVHEIAMMMSIALRFIPILLEETDKIMKAQMARGADFESGGMIKRIKSLVPLLVPLFVAAFRRANDLALAMEARCYRGGEGRTKMKPLVYQKRDYVAYGVLFAYLLVVIVATHIVPVVWWGFVV